jgi:adenylate cyclase
VSETRKLAAILCSDVVGYSRLAGADEDRILARLRSLRSDLIDPTIAVHHGRVVKRTGDGAIVEFRSIVDAVRCAIEVQNAMVERNAGVPEDRRIVFRIGIHVGDVVEESDGDLMGDGVNIAARLQGVAAPGSICLSEDAYRQVKGRLEVAVTDLGPTQLKNIAEPVRAYSLEVGKPALAKPAPATKPADQTKSVIGQVTLALPPVLPDSRAAGKGIAPHRPRSWYIPAAAGALIFALCLASVWWWISKPITQPDESAADAAVDARPSIVVLPFDNLNDDKEQEYLANGFTEDLTTELARVPGLFVISRNAASAYKGKETIPAEIAAALGVRYLLEGSIRRVGDDLRINAQLIDGSTAGHFWAERFDGKWADVFALQDKVVGRIAGALELRLVNGPQAGRAGGTSNPAAYDAYLRSLDISNRDNTADAFAAAVQNLKHAVQLDPNFGAAYAKLALLYWEAGLARAVMMGLSHDEARNKMYEALEAAAKHPSPGYYQLVAELMVRERNSDEAVSVLLKSVALDPSDSQNYLSLANALNFNGRPKDALTYLDAAARVDPNSSMDYRHYQAGLAAFGQEKFEDAVREIESMDLASVEPWTKLFALQILASAYAHLGRIEKAASAVEQLKVIVAKLIGDEPNLLATQDYMVFKNTADIERILVGLTRAGVHDLPLSWGMDPKNRLTGAEIRSLIFGHETRGKTVYPDFRPMQLTPLSEGAVREIVGETTRVGTAWVQGDFLCKAFPRDLTSCGAIFRNSFRTPGRQDEYEAVYGAPGWEKEEFSVVR